MKRWVYGGLVIGWCMLSGCTQKEADALMMQFGLSTLVWFLWLFVACPLSLFLCISIHAKAQVLEIEQELLGERGYRVNAGEYFLLAAFATFGGSLGLCATFWVAILNVFTLNLLTQGHFGALFQGSVIFFCVFLVASPYFFSRSLLGKLEQMQRIVDDAELVSLL